MASLCRGFLHGDEREGAEKERERKQIDCNMSLKKNWQEEYVLYAPHFCAN